MVIEDDERTNELFVEALGDSGFEVASAKDAETAVKMYEPHEYELFTLDIALPGMDGRDFCKWLRLQDDGENPYVLAITGLTEPDDLRAILDAGANDYIAKPITLDTLFVRLAVAETHIQQQRKFEEARDELMRLNRAFATIRDLVKDPIFEVDVSHGRIMANNEAAGILVGADDSELDRIEVQNVFPKWSLLTTDGSKQSPQMSRIRRLDGTTFEAELFFTNLSANIPQTALIIARPKSLV